MSDKLDDRYVEYDLDNSINVLDFAHGGTGTNTLAPNGNILIAQATGDPDPNKALRIADSGWGYGSLGALASWDPNKGPFEARVQNVESHVNDSTQHLPDLPATGGTIKFLNGMNSWVEINSTASNIYCTDEFHYSNATNVQDVLDDLDQALLDRAYNASMIACNNNFTNISATNTQAALEALDSAIPDVHDIFFDRFIRVAGDATGVGGTSTCILTSPNVWFQTTFHPFIHGTFNLRLAFSFTYYNNWSTISYSVELDDGTILYIGALTGTGSTTTDPNYQYVNRVVNIPPNRKLIVKGKSNKTAGTGTSDFSSTLRIDSGLDSQSLTIYDSWTKP